MMIVCFTDDDGGGTHTVVHTIMGNHNHHNHHVYTGSREPKPCTHHIAPWPGGWEVLLNCVFIIDT